MKKETAVQKMIFKLQIFLDLSAMSEQENLLAKRIDWKPSFLQPGSLAFT